MRLRTLVFLATLSQALPLAYARWDDPSAGLPLVETHRLGELTVSGIWAFAEDARGRLYAGSDSILEFDGERWSVIPVGRGNTILRLAVDPENRIWCGGANELGFLEENSSSARAYQSLHDKLPEDFGAFFVRGVHYRQGRVLFVLDDSLLIWHEGRFEHRLLPMAPNMRLVSFDFDGAAYVSQSGVGLHRWDGASLENVAWAAGSPEQVFAAWMDAQGRPVFLTSQSFVRVVDGVATRYGKETSAELAEARITSVVRLPDGSIAVASSQRGLFIMDDDGRIVRHLDRDDGLPHRAHMSLFVDRSDRLWVGAFAHAACSFDSGHRQTLFNWRNGQNGDVAAFGYSQATGVIGSTVEGLGRLVTRGIKGAAFAPLPFLPDATGEVFSLPDGRLLLTSQGTIWSLHADGATPLAACNSIFYQAAPLDPVRPRFALGDRAKLFSWDLDAAEPRRAEIAELPEQPTRLVGNGKGALWASMRRAGVVWIPESDKPAISHRRFRPGDELPLPFNDPAVFVLDGHAYAYAANALVALPQDPNGQSQVVGDRIGLWAAERTARESLWAIANLPGRTPRLVRLHHTPSGELRLQATDQSISGIGNVTVATRTQDHILWIGGSDGTLRIDTREVRDEPGLRPPVVQAAWWRASESERRLPLSGASDLAFHRSGALTLHLRDSADPLGAAPLIETRLAGTGETWQLTGRSRTITDLNEGTHTVEARTVSFLGTPGPMIRYTFTITPPWFRTPLAYLGYIFAFGASLYGAAQWRTRRIRRQNAQLEQLVNTRTEELAQAVSARSAFLANMGHEIRNPLNGVVGLVDTLRARELAPEQKGIVNRIGTCADQLISVIDDVLEYARIDAGRIALRNRAFTVREPVEGAIDILRAAKPEAVLELQGGGDDLDTCVIGDPDRIRHILVNYISNALKFGGGTPVQVAVRRDGPLLVLSVTDHGPGIAPEEQARLFVRFSRGSAAYRHGIPGTGLGLAACKAYAEAMGGDVSVESEPGHGATFFLRLPFRPAGEGAEDAAGPSRPDLMVGKRALVVDDQDFNRFVLTDLLGRMGATTDQASSIDEARAAFRARTPDIVFVDFDLAGGTGADLALWIRQEAPSGRDVPVVATTAFEVDEVRRKCEEAGMDGFLAKPVTAHRLAEVVARIESIRSGGPAPAAPTAHEPPTPSSFLDILAGGDPDKHREIERSTWREVLTEALAAHRALRRDDSALTARHAHRMVSAALILSERELVAAARELNALAKAADLPSARLCALRLRRHIRTLRQRKMT